MDKLGALRVIEAAVEGVSRVAARTFTMLDDPFKRHREMSGIVEARQPIEVALPAVRSLRDARDRVITEVEKWPLHI